MAFKDLLVTEIFHSLQGETSLSGLRFAFIRLTGCNLRCTYCDSAYAFKGGSRMSIDDVVSTLKPYAVKHALLTGGEPLLQKQSIELIERLNHEGYEVSVETHGEISIEKASKSARIVMDVKTPSSGMCRGFWKENLKFLKAGDEVKFVLASEEDYFWARDLILKTNFPVREILFSAAQPVKNTVGTAGSNDELSNGYVRAITTRWLAEKILEDRLPVRLQMQLHKEIWGQDRKGV